MTARNLTDVAYECLKRKRKEVAFNRLWEDVVVSAQLDQLAAKKRMVQFYNAIMMDARFVSLPDNKWDLRKRHTFDETRNTVVTVDDTDDDSDDLNENYDDYERDDEEY